MQKIKYWLKEICTVVFMATVLSSIGYFVIYARIYKIPIHELSNLTSHAAACCVIIAIALILTIVLTTVFGLSITWKTYEESQDAA